MIGQTGQLTLRNAPCATAVSAQLLIRLADLVELEVNLRARGRDPALCRAAAAVDLRR